METRLLEAEQLLKLLETAVAQAKEVVLITSAQRSKFKIRSLDEHYPTHPVAGYEAGKPYLQLFGRVKMLSSMLTALG